MTRPARACLDLRLVRRLMLWCLLLAVPVYGLSGAITALLGPMHIHRIVAVQESARESGDAALAGWQDFRRVSHLADSAIRVHTHDALGRHRHAIGDPTVLSFGADEQENSADNGAAFTGAPLVFVAIRALVVSPGSGDVVGSAGWHRALAGNFLSADPRRLERPPIA